ncbi:MAG: DEAD/DEAH box helicase [Thermonemataceae bacterium]|nr:DEAD/DEAH box helicase [Thermonemataceae bacterium]
MKVAPTQPFTIVFSLLKHEYLGYLISPFAVQMNGKGLLTLQYQGLTSKTAKDFHKKIDAQDTQIIKLCDSLQIEQIIKKFYQKKIHQNDFFLKIYHKDKGDKNIQTYIEQYVDSKIAQILRLIFEHQKPFFVMGTDGNPIWKEVKIAQEPVSVLFHFRRNEKDIHYFPTLKFEGQKLNFQHKNALILCNEPAWMLLDNTLYHFSKNIDGNKIKPFLQKWHIAIPRNIEEKYLQSFVKTLIASFDVATQGFSIQKITQKPKAILKLSTSYQKANISLFETEITDNEIDNNFLFELYFEYGNFLFKAKDKNEAFVQLEKNADSYTFFKINRDLSFENDILFFLENNNLDMRQGKKVLSSEEALIWLERNALELEKKEIVFKQNTASEKKYAICKNAIQFRIKENKDWFDLEATIYFGEYAVPFSKLKPFILARKKEYKLPNGEIAIIPEEWFSKYTDLFVFAETGENLYIAKHHLYILDNLSGEKNVNISAEIEQKILALQNIATITDYPTPKFLKAKLRNYQKQGYNWLRLLGEYRLGACLADDMGLGKTLQTLAVLQAEKEIHNENKRTSLVIAPTSLIYNWQLEAKKFSPQLQVASYIGTNREKLFPYLHKFDVIFSSYGTVRMDIDALEKVPFNYIVLDESQVIKNPQAHISQAVKRLNADKKILLTGTPIENTLMDLWSQMNFANDGLLGSQTFFKKEYLNPIEKANNLEKLEKLQAITQKFILRRTKEQVAKELPSKIENLHFSEMSQEQESYYERIKSQYRNKILEQIEQFGFQKTQFLLLKGLTMLRQIANHPILVDDTYEGSSGKMKDVIYQLETLLSEKKKVLIFSQFVKHLALFKNYLDKRNIKYAYLDGSTTNRQSQVELFQGDKDTLIFLISIKAGGVGLNLTAAEYVFLLDPWWNPAVEAQAVDRAHRIGQKHTVITYKFISKNSVEEKILALQNSKKILANSIISQENSFLKNLNYQDIEQLFA